MKTNIALAILVVALAIGYYLEVSENGSLRSQLAAVQAKLTQKQAAEDAKIAAKRIVGDTIGDLPKDSSQQKSEPVANTPQASHREHKDMSGLPGGFFADRQIDAIDQAITLNDSEKSQLKDRLSSLFSSEEYQGLTDEEKDEQLKTAISDAVGDERADLYMGIRRDAEIKAENDSRELASTTFAKRLNLSADQESRVSRIMQQVDQELGTPTRMLKQKITELHSSGGNKDPAQLMKQYVNVSKEIRDQRRTILNQQLQGILTKEQFNTLLSEQAAAPEALWGLRGY